MTAPLVPVAAAFAAGVWLGLDLPAPAWLGAAGLGLGLLALEAARRGRLGAASLATLLLVALAGWARAALPPLLPAVTGLRPGSMRLEGLVGGDVETDGPRTRIPLVLDGVVTEQGLEPASGRLAVALYGVGPTVEPGARVRLDVRLSRPRPFRNPGEPGLSQSRVDAPFLAVGRAASVERLPDGPRPWWLRVRLWVHRLVEAELPPVSGALFEGLLIGERRALPPTLLADFRAAGVFHILAISGFNVGLVAAAVLFLLPLLRLPPRPAAALALGALVAFAAIVGAQPSVLRAAVMGSLVLGARLLRRESHTWNGVAAALVALLVIAPASLADPGLQLSFAATAGILHLGPPLQRHLQAWWPRPLAAAGGVSAGAQLAVTPLMVAYWSQLSLIGVAANLVVVPLAAALTILGLLALAVSAASGTAAHLVFQGLWALLVALRLVVRAIAALPGAVVYVPEPPAVAFLAAAGALALAPLATGWRGRALVTAMAGFAVSATLAGYGPDGRLHVLVLDVGQGDAILVRGPDGRALLVDTGGGGPGRADRGERVILPLLHRAGIRRLAALAVTHGDPDHAGGLASVLGGIPVDEIWVAAGTEGADWQQPIAAAGATPRALARGDRAWLGPVLVTVLHPPRAGPPGPLCAPFDRNNGSLVLRVEWGAAAIVLTGDAEERAERDVLASGLPLRAALLKVGHHGSRAGSSAPFLRALGPRLAVISVGARNPFGHPTPATLARLAEAGAAIYRTDEDGAVEVTTDAERLWVRRWARPGQLDAYRLRSPGASGLRDVAPS